MDHVPAEVCKAALQLRILLPVSQATPALDLSSPVSLGWSADMGPPQVEARGCCAGTTNCCYHELLHKLVTGTGQR